MKDLKRIVIAYDGKEDSNRAVEYGVTLKKAFPEAVLTIVQVLDEMVESRMIESVSAPGFVPAADFYVNPPQTHPVTEVEHQLQMKANDTPTVFENNARVAESQILSLLNEYQVRGEIEILDGNASDSICQFAERTNADLIIVGNSSKSGLERFFLGSTSSSIAKHAPCSVFIAK